MTIAQALRRAAHTLDQNAIASPDFEAEYLLRHTLNVDRAGLYLCLQEELAPSHAESFERLLRRRLERQPAAYIVEERQFFGIDLYVDGRVLVPRPETELLVEKAIEIARRSASRDDCVIADIGTGSGAIAIALALNLPCSQVYATDISAAALEVAALNCRRHRVLDRVKLLLGDLAQPLSCPLDIMLANLPYVADQDLESLEPEVRLFEPRLALSGGGDGLDMIRRFLTGVAGKLLPGGWLLLEVGLGQAPAVVAEMERWLPLAEVAVAPDLAGVDRAVIAQLQ